MIRSFQGLQNDIFRVHKVKILPIFKKRYFFFCTMPNHEVFCFQIVVKYKLNDVAFLKIDTIRLTVERREIQEYTDILSLSGNILRWIRRYWKTLSNLDVSLASSREIAGKLIWSWNSQQMLTYLDRGNVSDRARSLNMWTWSAASVSVDWLQVHLIYYILVFLTMAWH